MPSGILQGQLQTPAFGAAPAAQENLSAWEAQLQTAQPLIEMWAVLPLTYLILTESRQRTTHIDT
jgi:hypothetical protein